MNILHAWATIELQAVDSHTLRSAATTQVYSIRLNLKCHNSTSVRLTHLQLLQLHNCAVCMCGITRCTIFPINCQLLQTSWTWFTSWSNRIAYISYLSKYARNGGGDAKNLATPTAQVAPVHVCMSGRTKCYVDKLSTIHFYASNSRELRSQAQ